MHLPIKAACEWLFLAEVKLRIQSSYSRSFSVVGCLSGKSSQRTALSTVARKSPLTARAQWFLSTFVPRAYKEAIAQNALSRVTSRLWWYPAILDGLTVEITFSTSTLASHYKGLTLLRTSRDSRLFVLKISQTVIIGGKNLLELLEISPKKKPFMNSSIYRVLTSHGTIHAEALHLHALLFGQLPERVYRESKKVWQVIPLCSGITLGACSRCISRHRRWKATP
jgi:hypothetical protein